MCSVLRIIEFLRGTWFLINTHIKNVNCHHCMISYSFDSKEIAIFVHSNEQN